VTITFVGPYLHSRDKNWCLGVNTGSISRDLRFKSERDANDAKARIEETGDVVGEFERAREHAR
jgi:hypothetical protein